MNKIEELRYLIKAIDKEGEAYYSQLLAPLSITPNQNEVLKILDVKNGLSIKEIGQLLICGSDSPSRVIQRLIDKDLVVKVSDENDERKVNVILTPTGKKLLKESDCIFYDWNGTSKGMYDHVDYYVGGDVTYSHGGPGKGPTIQSFQSQWNAAHYIIARRYLPDIPVIPSEPSKTSFKTIPMSNFPLMRTEYFGDINGPKNSRGGYYLWERKYVKMIQEWLVEHEYAGNVDPANWCDGLFEQPTIDAVAAMQRAELPGTTLFGQVWWDDWAHMMANNGQG